jgi:hypothetical protein
VTKILLIAAVLPGLFWKYDANTSEQVKSANLPRVYVADGAVAEWRKHSVEVESALALKSYVRVPAPTAQMRVDVASATSVPWIEANGWRFLRGVNKAVYENVPAGRGALSAAEAYAYGVDAVIEAAQQDLPAISRMISFEQRLGDAHLPVLANIGVVDDGSADLDEVLNLLGRRNLLYKVVRAPDAALDLNVRLGTPQYPREAAKDANDFAARVREELSDEKRLVRLFGSYTVLAHLTGEGGRVRLHLLNYGNRPVEDLRVSVLGTYEQVQLAESSNPEQHGKDITSDNGRTEVTVPLLRTYAVIDFSRTQ